MKRSARNSWFRIYQDAWSLGFEASSVIGLRLIKHAAGGSPARTEAVRMVTEKIEAAITLQAQGLAVPKVLSAASATTLALSHYRRKVRANLRRLAKV